MPKPLLKILPYGSCSAHDPVYNLGQRGLAFPVWYRIRARETLYAHTIGEFIQLTKFLRGDLAIERSIRRYICIDYDFEPGEEARKAVDDAELILLEICTSENIKLDGWFLHRNQLPRLFMKPMMDSEILSGDVKKAVTFWWAGLTNRKDQQQIEAAKVVAAHLPAEADDEVTRAILFGARLVADTQQEIEDGVDQLLSLQQRRSAIFLIHYRRFMPDGRAICWPPELRGHLYAIAKRLNVEIFDPAQMIVDHGVGAAIAADQLHYEKAFVPIVADALWRTIKSEARA